MILIDTHILLWMFFEPNKLPIAEKNIIHSREYLFLYSGISLWELSIKFGLNKFISANFTPEW